MFRIKSYPAIFNLYNPDTCSTNLYKSIYTYDRLSCTSFLLSCRRLAVSCTNQNVSLFRACLYKILRQNLTNIIKLVHVSSACVRRITYFIVRPLSTVGYTSVASVIHCRQGLTKIIQDHSPESSVTQLHECSVFWKTPLFSERKYTLMESKVAGQGVNKGLQAKAYNRATRVSLQHVKSLQTL